MGIVYSAAVLPAQDTCICLLAKQLNSVIVLYVSIKMSVCVALHSYFSAPSHDCDSINIATQLFQATSPQETQDKENNALPPHLQLVHC